MRKRECVCVLCCNFTVFYGCKSIIWTGGMDTNGGDVTAVITMAQIDNKASTAECVSGSTLLTHLLEDVSAAADLTQQLAVGDGQVMARRVPFPEEGGRTGRKKETRNLSVPKFFL